MQAFSQAGAFDEAGEKDSSQALSGKVSQITSLFDYFSKRMKSYYGKDANTYRVRRFLKWLEANDEKLTKLFKQEFLSGNIKIQTSNQASLDFIAGFFLGTRHTMSYINDKWAEKTYPGCFEYRPPDLRQSIYYGVNETAYFIPNTILTPKEYDEPIEAFLMGFNGGAHEAGHSISQVLYPESDLRYTELTAYITQSSLALPIKTAHLRGRHHKSIRDIREYVKHIKEGIPGFSYGKLLGEYFAHAIGPWIKLYYPLEKVRYYQDLGKSFPTLYIYSGYYNGSPAGPRTISADDICRESSILSLNDDLRLKLGRVLDGLREAKYTNEEQFFDAFISLMNKNFGIPADENIPEGYSFLDSGDLRNFTLGGITPKRTPG